MNTTRQTKTIAAVTLLTLGSAAAGWLGNTRLQAARAALPSEPAVLPSEPTIAWDPLSAPEPREEPKTKPVLSRESAANYRAAIARTASMTHDSDAQRLAERFGLNVMNVTWEDTGRYKGSSVGPNISDMTIQVAERDPATERMNVTCMPVIRHPNFSDKSCDLDPRDFTLLVGNHARRGRGKPALRRVSLYDFLEDPTGYLSRPASWKHRTKTLLAPERDSKVLVSAQACFLPVPKQGIANFNPVLFNYQSYEKNPAVLTVLATREGTSVTVIDNKRDAFETGGVWGQRLFHNQQGMRASLTGQRLSDFKAAQQSGSAGTPSVEAQREASLNMVLLIQIPLKQKERPRRMMAMYEMTAAPSAAAGAGVKEQKRGDRSNVENAVIGHGDLEGPFTEIDDLAIERDPRFPVRVTVQFYKATDNGVVSEDDLREIKEQIDQVYSKSDYVGSLVTEGATGRVTEYDGPKVEPADWWARFWDRYEQNTGINREEAIRRLREMLGNRYQSRPVTELYLRDLLRRKS